MGDVLTGIAIGLVTSIVAWLITQTLLKPRIRFATKISREPSPSTPCGFRYQIKLQNISWFRSALSVEAVAVVVFPGMIPERPWAKLRVRLDMSTEQAPRIRPGVTKSWFIDPGSISQHARRRLCDLGHGTLAEDDERTLEEILGLEPPESPTLERREEPYIVLEMLANDAWSGAQFFRQSERIRADDISDRPFARAEPSKFWARVLRLEGEYPALELAGGRAGNGARDGGEPLDVTA